MHRIRTIHLFAGAGGGILGDLLLGHRPIAAVEIDPYCQQVLSARQKDGILPWFPFFDDIREFDGKQFEGLADCIAGGFPCQDISCAGKGKGIEGERSGLWSEMARVVGEVRPLYVLVENSPRILHRNNIDGILGDLAELGYDCRWGVFSACAIGAPHSRERLFLLAYSNVERHQTSVSSRNGRGKEQSERYENTEHIFQASRSVGRKIWPKTSPESGVCGVAHGVAHRVDRLKAIGNGQVPQCMALAWEILSK